MACKYDFTKYSQAELLAFDLKRTLDPIFAIKCGSKLRKEITRRQQENSTKLLDKIFGDGENPIFPDQVSSGMKNPIMTKGEFALLKLIVEYRKKKLDQETRIRTQCSCT